MQQKSVAVFVSYSHKDAAWLEELRPHLKAVARKHKLQLAIWDDSQIQPGDEWRRKLDESLTSAQGAVLLVSKYFLDSEFILEVELPRLLAAVDEKGARLFTLVLSPCRFDDLPELSKFQTINPPSRTLEGLPKVECEAVFVELTRRIEQLLLEGDHKPRELEREAPGTEVGARPISVPAPIPKPEAVVPSSLPGWQRVVARSEPNGDLTFLAIQDGRRIESRVTGAELALVDEFLRSAVGDTRFQAEVGRTLLQLLVPQAFRHVLFDGSGTVLVLDDRTARFPWELLSADAHQPGFEPCVIRELQMMRFAPVAPATDGGALVIGDPRVDAAFSPLPGAANEARRVAEVLRASGQIRVREIVDATAAEVIQAWFGEPWRILHFAGHGVADYRVGQAGEPNAEQESAASRRVTGLVLDNGLFLTAAEVRQMIAVPDLVFLNAAHMGVISDVRADGAGAPSLATEFAALGCRAIIATGWTIDDAAAETFATAFYESLLGGRTLGESVAAARRATREAHPHVNTWAAYQCYGDPGFVLSEKPVALAGVKSRPGEDSVR